MLQRCSASLRAVVVHHHLPHRASSSFSSSTARSGKLSSDVRCNARFIVDAVSHPHCSPALPSSSQVCSSHTFTHRTSLQQHRSYHAATTTSTTITTTSTPPPPFPTAAAPLSTAAASSPDATSITPSPEPLPSSVITSAIDSSYSVPMSPPLPAPLCLRMPSIDGVGKCRLQRWLVRTGDAYTSGTILCEIDSDLAVIEYKAQTSGILGFIRTRAGDRIHIDQILALQVGTEEEMKHVAEWNEQMLAEEQKDKQELKDAEEKEEKEAKEARRIEDEHHAKQQQQQNATKQATKQTQTDP